MAKIPLYLKTKPEMKRPQESEYYLMTGDGVFFCRNHPLFQSDVPARRLPGWLARHQSRFRLHYPRVAVTTLEYIVGFFHRVYQLHGSEAIVLLYWDSIRHRWRVRVPEQQATVSRSITGRRYALDVQYQIPGTTSKNLLLAASIHSHASSAAYSSCVDAQDELYRDGVHAVVGIVDRDPPDFHLEFAVDGFRFPLQFQQLFRGYSRRREIVPRQWMEKVEVQVTKPYCSSWVSNGGGSYGQDWSSSQTKRWWS